MLTMSLGPVFGSSLLAAFAVAIAALAGTVTRRRNTVVNRLPLADDTEQRIQDLTRKVRRNARIRSWFR